MFLKLFYIRFLTRQDWIWNGILHTQFSSVQFSHLVVSNSMWSHEPQHTRPPCPSPTPRVHPNPCPLLVMPSNHLILCRPLLLLPSIFLSIRVFSNESALHIRWPKYCSFSFNISPSNEHLGLISLRMDWLDLLAVQGTLKSLLEHHSSKASILRCSAFFIVQLSHPLWCAKYCIKKEQWWDHDIAVYWRNPTSHLETSEPVSLYKG